jgi:hypothetical protein
LIKNGATDKEKQRYFEAEKRGWQAIIERIISVVQFLAGQCLACRGQNNKFYQ